MTRAGPIVVAVIAALLASPLSAREYRSREVTREFQREHPCPSTGKTSGACPGCAKECPEQPLTYDPRIKAAVIADPLALWFTADSLQEIKVPIQLWASELGATA